MTAVFENLGRTAARAQGYPDLRMLVLPHPMEARPLLQSAHKLGVTREAMEGLLAASGFEPREASRSGAGVHPAASSPAAAGINVR